MDGKLKTKLDAFQYRYTPHVLSVKSLAQYLRLQLKNDFFYIYFTSDGHANTIISRRACAIIWCPKCRKWHLRVSRFQNFLWGHAPDPPRLRGLTASFHRGGYSPLTGCLQVLQILLNPLHFNINKQLTKRRKQSSRFM